VVLVLKSKLDGKASAMLNENPNSVPQLLLPEVYSAQLANFFLNCHADYLLTIEDLSHIIRKSHLTIRSDVNRRPESLPVITRLGRSGNVHFRVGDVIEFIKGGRTVTAAPVASVPVSLIATPAPRRRGAPTKRERLERLKAGGAL